jgi:hypothetical protein
MMALATQVSRAAQVVFSGINHVINHKMAKSLRSKPMRKQRSILRKQVHEPVEKARLQRLADKQEEIAQENPISKRENDQDKDQDKEEDKEDAMDVEIKGNLKKKNPELYLSRNQNKKLLKRTKFKNAQKKAKGVKTGRVKKA